MISFVSFSLRQYFSPIHHQLPVMDVAKSRPVRMVGEDFLRSVVEFWYYRQVNVAQLGRAVVDDRRYWGHALHFYTSLDISSSDCLTREDYPGTAVCLSLMTFSRLPANQTLSRQPAEKVPPRHAVRSSPETLPSFLLHDWSVSDFCLHQLTSNLYVNGVNF